MRVTCPLVTKPSRQRTHPSPGLGGGGSPAEIQVVLKEGPGQSRGNEGGRVREEANSSAKHKLRWLP